MATRRRQALDEYSNEAGNANREKARRDSIVWPRVSWQDHFSNLRELDVTFTVEDNDHVHEQGRCCVGRDALAKLEKLLSRTEMRWKADRVKLEFETFRHECSHHSMLKDLE
jgi:hypothetical protein